MVARPLSGSYWSLFHSELALKRYPLLTLLQPYMVASHSFLFSLHSYIRINFSPEVHRPNFYHKPVGKKLDSV
jgi:hypothetical protein